MKKKKSVIKDILIPKLRREIAITIDAAEFEGIENYRMPEFDGIFTIKNINPDTSDDKFYIHPENTIPGFVEVSGARYINLINGKKKMIRSICNSYYHAVIDDISDILYAIENYPDHELIIDVSDISNGLNSHVKYWDVFNFFVETLEQKKIKYTLVSFKKYDVIYIDNFKIIEFVYETGRKANLVHDFFKDRVKNKDVVPHRNVFVSRLKREELAYEYPQEGTETLEFGIDVRMDNNDALERYFGELGYEIVHAELFESFEQQLNYFYEAKTIASVSGSGLTNAALMQPGGTLIEIVTPLVTTVPPPTGPKDITKPYYVQEVHNFYKMLAFYMNHKYVAIQNLDRSFEKFWETIESDPRLKGMIDRNEKTDNL